METVLLESNTGASSVAPALPENALERRYAEKVGPEQVTYEFTRDLGLLHQYYQLREQMFISVWGLKHFYGGKDKYDDISDILIARSGNLCVGGGRLTYSSPKNPIDTPIEYGDFRLQKLFPELDLGSKIYAECTRLALLPEYRTKEISFEIYRRIVQYHLRIKASYGFWVAPLPLARTYRQNCINLGFPCKIRLDIEIPDKEDYQGIKMCIGVMDFTSALSAQIPATSNLVTAD